MGTIDVQVATSGSDAYAATGDSDFQIAAEFARVRQHSATPYGIGVHFSGVGILQGDTINSSYLSFYAYNATNDDMYGDIYGNNVDNADDFVAEAAIWGRDLTAASVSWIEEGIAAGGATWCGDNIEIKTIVQEIVNRGSWASGNSMAFMILGKTDATEKNFYARTYDNDTTLAAKLFIGFSSGSITVSTTEERNPLMVASMHVGHRGKSNFVSLGTKPA